MIEIRRFNNLSRRVGFRRVWFACWGIPLKRFGVVKFDESIMDIMELCCCLQVAPLLFADVGTMRINLPPIAYALLIAHFVFFSIVGGFAIYRMGH